MIELLLSYNYYSGRQFDMPDLDPKIYNLFKSDEVPQ